MDVNSVGWKLPAADTDPAPPQPHQQQQPLYPKIPQWAGGPSPTAPPPHQRTMPSPCYFPNQGRGTLSQPSVAAIRPPATVITTPHRHFGPPNAIATPVIQAGPTPLHPHPHPHHVHPQWHPGSDGSVPQNAVIGGKDVSGEPLYIARARYGGALIPGKLVPSHKGCYVAWGGKEELVKHYEVLCNTDGDWQETRKSEIPLRALEAGYTETGEKLYIGRVPHKKSYTLGKVHPSHKCCYISFAGKEIAYKAYDIFVPK